ncbi:MAG TPA: hypothetical protein VGL77_02490 [Armatimonadota bacterium]|jgi:hypothetical protein
MAAFFTRYYRLSVLCLGLTLCCAFAWAAGPLACPRCISPKVIDGRLDDWPESSLLLDGAYWRPLPNVPAIYGGLYDLSGTVQLAWDAQRLYVAVTVVDDVFLPARQTPIDTGDAVLLIFAPSLPSARPLQFAFTLAPITQVYGRDGKGYWTPLRPVRIGVSRLILATPKTPLPHERTKTMPAHITKIIYELAIPWVCLPGFTAKPQTILGLQVQMLDADGPALRGSLLWRGGRGVPVTPAGYGQVLLSAATPAAGKPAK